MSKDPISSDIIRQIARDIENYGVDHAIVLNILRHSTYWSYAPTVLELASLANLRPDDALDVVVDLVRVRRANWSVIREDRLNSTVRAA